MPATVEVRVFHGSSPGLGVDASGATLYLKQADNDVQDDQFAVPVPDSGDPPNYSWRKITQLVVLTAPDNRVSNLRFFSDGGSLGTGRRILFGLNPLYSQPVSADALAPVSAVDLVSLTVVSPEVLEPGELANSGDAFPTAAGVSGSQDHVETQLEVSSTAIQGNSAGSIVSRYRYNET